MKEQQKKVYNILGLAIKANKIVYGARLLAAIRAETVSLVLSSEAIGATQKKMFAQKCFFYNINYHADIAMEVFTKLFSHKNVKTIGIIDTNFAQKIIADLKS